MAPKSIIGVAVDTLIKTKKGDKKVQDLVGKTIYIWNGEDWQETTFTETKGSQLVRYVYMYGIDPPVRCTKDTWVYNDKSQSVRYKDVRTGHCLKTVTGDLMVVDTMAGNMVDNVYGCLVKGSHVFALGNGLLIGDSSGYSK